jgi:hypothetical protein
LEEWKLGVSGIVEIRNNKIFGKEDVLFDKMHVYDLNDPAIPEISSVLLKE